MSRIGVLVTCACLLALVVLPFGTVVVESLTVGEVRTTSGEVFRGLITFEDESKVAIRPRSTGRTEEFDRADVEFAGTVLALDNYDGMFSGATERNMLLGTLALAGVSTLLALLIGLPLGLLFGACRFPGKSFDSASDSQTFLKCSCFLCREFTKFADNLDLHVADSI